MRHSFVDGMRIDDQIGYHSYKHLIGKTRYIVLLSMYEFSTVKRTHLQQVSGRASPHCSVLSRTDLIGDWTVCLGRDDKAAQGGAYLCHFDSSSLVNHI
eukprot:2478067-Amphidinium_carterae.1